MKGSERLTQRTQAAGQSEKGTATGQKHEAVGGEKAAGVASRIFTLAAWSNRAQDLTSGAQGPCWLAGTGWLLAGAPGPDAPPAGLRGGALPDWLPERSHSANALHCAQRSPACLPGRGSAAQPRGSCMGWVWWG